MNTSHKWDTYLSPHEAQGPSQKRGEKIVKSRNLGVAEGNNVFWVGQDHWTVMNSLTAAIAACTRLA